jgi:two-component system response regulator HydG
VEAPSPAPTLQHRIIGESPAIRNVLEFVARVAPLDSTVLITGQKGAGKKRIAQALHDNGPRAQRPFFAANCAAVSEAFLESDLFGQEADALHGVPAARPGKVELAEGGTLFLDEIGELPPALQGRLLRLLQENRFERTGGTQTLTANVRVLASTSRDLAAAAQNAAFRPDLYFRLCVLSVALPPLRQRSQDIALLANYFRVQQSTRQQRRVLGITAAAHDCLLHYGWPGNVSELQSAIASAVAVGCTEGILPEDLPDSVLPGVDAPADALPRFNQVLIETKRELILKAYQQARGSHVHAASQLGLHPESLLRLVRSLGLEAAIRSLNGAGSQSGTS